jgi:hypothetical protein
MLGPDHPPVIEETIGMSRPALRVFAPAFALAAALAGCAAPPVHWVKDGASEQDFLADGYACERDLRQSAFAGGLIGLAERRRFARACMAAHGWLPEDVASARAAAEAESAWAAAHGSGRTAAAVSDAAGPAEGGHYP